MTDFKSEALFLARQRLLSGNLSKDDERLLLGLLQIVQQQAQELDALKRISLNLTSSLELGNVLYTVALEAIKLVQNARTVHIFLYQNDKLRFGTSLDGDGRRNVMMSEPRPNGLTYTVARTSGTVIVEDMQNHPLYQGAPKDWIGSIIGIPLKMSAHVVAMNREPIPTLLMKNSGCYNCWPTRQRLPSSTPACMKRSAAKRIPTS
jgi:GAF domain-containing protein